jgi:hypothetical protein
MRPVSKGVRKILILLAGAFLMLLCGCAGVSAEEFYALPQLSEEYVQLQNRINEILADGAEYSAPSSGSNRQAVQLEDINGDGDKEAIVFFRFAGSDKPQKIYIFKNIDGAYEEVARIEGEGSGIDKINYTDMDGDGVKEIAVGWQIASGLNMLTLYSMRDFQPIMLMNTDYTRYITYDLDGNGNNNIVVVRLATSETSGEVILYSLTDEGEVVNTTAMLSSGVESIRRVRTGKLVDGSQSIIVESTFSGSGIITDVMAYKNNTVVNVSMDENTGTSDTARSRDIYSRDINGDGVLDIPSPVALPSLTEGTVYYLIDWYDYKTNGKSTKVCTTYTNYSDYWNLVIPNEWTDVITVRRQDVLSGERTIIFSYIGSGLDRQVDFLEIYTLSGDNRDERATSGNRFVLARDDETIYAAEILRDNIRLNVSEELIRENFSILYSEWQTGET